MKVLKGIFIIIVIVIIAFVMIGIIGTNISKNKQASKNIDYKIIETKMLNDTLVVSVNYASDKKENLMSVAKEIVNNNKNKYQIRIFFYSSDNEENPDHRISWISDTDNYILDF